MSNEVIPSPLQNPTELALLDSATVLQFGRTLVVAPHPDDESLGCGGAIALLHSMGCPVRVLVLSNGTLSHPRSRRYPAPVLAELREQETLQATKILGVQPEAIKFLRLQDGSIPVASAAEFKQTVKLVQEYLVSFAPETIILPWRRDPHPDHRAAWQLMQAAVTDLLPRLVEYPIWDWDPAQRSAEPELAQITAWRLDISAVLPLKLEAIAAHRSQTTNLIDDDPDGFRLSPEMLANFAHPWELYLELN